MLASTAGRCSLTYGMMCFIRSRATNVFVASGNTGFCMLVAAMSNAVAVDAKEEAASSAATARAAVEAAAGDSETGAFPAAGVASAAFAAGAFAAAATASAAASASAAANAVAAPAALPSRTTVDAGFSPGSHPWTRVLWLHACCLPSPLHDTGTP